MTDRIETAKNTAAVRALETYAKCLKELLTPEELKRLDAHNTDHVHTAVLLVDDRAVAIVAHWVFVTDPEKVAQLIALKRGQGRG